MLSCKLYIWNTRDNTKIIKIIRHKEELQLDIQEFGKIELSSDKTTTWTEEVNMMIRERNLDIRYEDNRKQYMQR